MKYIAFSLVLAICFLILMTGAFVEVAEAEETTTTPAITTEPATTTVTETTVETTTVEETTTTIEETTTAPPEETTTTTTIATTTTSTIPPTTTTTVPQELSASITLPKTTYYPAERFVPKVTVRDPEGKIVIDATVTGTLTYGTEQTYLRFFYSTLCDCYKTYHWFSEGTLPNDYTLTVTASYLSYESATATTSFPLIKPTLHMTMSTDKTEYNPGDSIRTTVEIKDSLGNIITDARVTGDIRDADTGDLIRIIYPRLREGAYYYEYYIGLESLGKSYTVSVSASWKEQSASDSKTVYVARRGLNADIVLEKDVLIPGDTLQGKIKVFDKDGNIITDARVNVEIRDSDNNRFRYLSAEYKDGFYEIEKWKIEDWVSTGIYTLNVKIEKAGETITLKKTIEITKEKLNVQVILDQTGYAPGDRIYIKILVTYEDGSIVPDAYIGGEIFPLTQEVISTPEEASGAGGGGGVITGEIALVGITGKVVMTSPGVPIPTAVIGEPTHLCRIHISPEGPLYYQGEYIQRYYIDDAYIPEWCPTGKYVLRLRIGVHGYADTEFTREFNVALYKLLLETGFKIDSRPGAVDMSIYAEVKDEKGRVVPHVNIKGYLHPFEEGVEECVKRVYLRYDEFTSRYTSNVFLANHECPAGEYLLEITASQPSYETATVEQLIEIKYEDYEYNVIIPSTIGEPVCREVSCGPNCFTKVCEAPRLPEECYEEVTDKECVKDCTSRAAGIEEIISRGEVAVEFDVKACIEDCVKRIPCKGSAVSQPQSQDMLDKLEEIHEEVRETRREVNVVEQLVRSIIDFFNSVVAAFGGGRVTPIETGPGMVGPAFIQSSPARIKIGPGGCASNEECKEYCENNADDCLNWCKFNPTMCSLEGEIDLERVMQAVFHDEEEFLQSAKEIGSVITIDFETLPDGTLLSDGMKLTGEEYSSLGVTFSAPSEDYLQAFGPHEPFKPIGSLSLSPGNGPFTPPDNASDDDLDITFTTPVSAVGLYMLDLGGRDSKESVTFFDENGEIIKSIPLNIFVGVASPNVRISKVSILENAYDGDDVAYDNIHFVK